MPEKQRQKAASTAPIAYAGPVIIISALNLALIVYIPPVYVTEIGPNLTAIGLACSVTRASGTVLDPIMGT